MSVGNKIVCDLVCQIWLVVPEGFFWTPLTLTKKWKLINTRNVIFKKKLEHIIGH